MINRMFDSILKDKWINSMRHYLKSNLYSNVTFSDLTDAMTESGVSQENIQSFTNWLYYSGFPVIKISLGQGKALIEQFPSSFYLNETQIWKIHLSILVIYILIFFYFFLFLLFFIFYLFLFEFFFYYF